MPFPCLQVRRSARTHAAAPMRTLLVSAMRLLITVVISNSTNRGFISGMHGDSAAISELSPDHPVGPKGTYRSGQTWIEPAVANNSSTKNTGAIEPARALFVPNTNETSSPEPEDR
jgi:hypothetical protein